MLSAQHNSSGNPQLGLTKCCKDVADSAAQKNINTSEAGVGTGKEKKTIGSNGDPAAQKNINTSEAGVGTGKDNITAKTNLDTDMDAYAFIWTLQTLDSRGVPFGDGNVNGDGISEPNIFFVDRRPMEKRRSGPPSRINNMKGRRN